MNEPTIWGMRQSDAITLAWGAAFFLFACIGVAWVIAKLIGLWWRFVKEQPSCPAAPETPTQQRISEEKKRTPKTTLHRVAFILGVGLLVGGWALMNHAEQLRIGRRYTSGYGLRYDWERQHFHSVWILSVGAVLLAVVLSIRLFTATRQQTAAEQSGPIEFPSIPRNSGMTQDPMP